MGSKIQGLGLAKKKARAAGVRFHFSARPVFVARASLLYDTGRVGAMGRFPNEALKQLLSEGDRLLLSAHTEEGSRGK
jgi:hypothetical protein